MQRYGPYWLCAVAVLTALWCAHPAAAVDGLLCSTIEESRRMMVDGNRHSGERFLSTLLNNDRADFKKRRRFRLNVEPLVNEIAGMLRDAGVPLHPTRDPAGGRTVGFAAAFHIREDLPAVSFHIADRSPEPIGAFYSRQRGLSWAFIWPVQRFTIRIEGGDDSEFGYFAIAGAQWNHSTRPLSAGIGLPMNLRNADGSIGVILQFRAKLY